jgi:hypothetical protein
MKRFLHITYVFVLSLGFSAIWELSQIGFYTIGEDYRSYIPSFLLFAFKDAAILLAIYLFLGLIHQNISWERWWSATDTIIIVVSTLGIATFMELRALNAGTLEYSPYMPIIPGVGVGIIPAIQLTLTSLIVFHIAKTKLTG